MVWADEFTLQMGLEFDDLFGIFAMPQSFADAPRLLKIFHGMINADRSAASVGCSREERFNRLHDVMSGCSQREQEAMMKFWNFSEMFVCAYAITRILEERSEIFQRIIIK